MIETVNPERVVNNATEIPSDILSILPEEIKRKV